jgi:hypothetical protein
MSNWTTSESIKDISAALTKALGELSDVPKGREAKIPTKSGSNYSYKYADLADALSMVRPIFALHGLAVMQNASTMSPDYVMISTTVVHSSGEWITFEPLAMPAGRTAQETGSAITYGRRYHLLAVLGLAADDDDGATAAPRQTNAKAGNSASKQQSAPKAPEPRSDAEKAIRKALTELPATTAKEVKKNFVAEFGPLIDLDPSLHDAALAWVEAQIAKGDEADAEWVKEAKGEQ